MSKNLWLILSCYFCIERVSCRCDFKNPYEEIHYKGRMDQHWTHVVPHVYHKTPRYPGYTDYNRKVDTSPSYRIQGIISPALKSNDDEQAPFNSLYPEEWGYLGYGNFKQNDDTKNNLPLTVKPNEKDHKQFFGFNSKMLDEFRYPEYVDLNRIVITAPPYRMQNVLSPIVKPSEKEQEMHNGFNLKRPEHVMYPGYVDLNRMVFNTPPYRLQNVLTPAVKPNDKERNVVKAFNQKRPEENRYPVYVDLNRMVLTAPPFRLQNVLSPAVKPNEYQQQLFNSFNAKRPETNSYPGYVDSNRKVFTAPPHRLQNVLSPAVKPNEKDQELHNDFNLNRQEKYKYHEYADFNRMVITRPPYGIKDTLSTAVKLNETEQEQFSGLNPNRPSEFYQMVDTEPPYRKNYTTPLAFKSDETEKEPFNGFNRNGPENFPFHGFKAVKSETANNKNFSRVDYRNDYNFQHQMPPSVTNPMLKHPNNNNNPYGFIPVQRKQEPNEILTPIKAFNSKTANNETIPNLDLDSFNFHFQQQHRQQQPLGPNLEYTNYPHSFTPAQKIQSENNGLASFYKIPALIRAFKHHQEAEPGENEIENNGSFYKSFEQNSDELEANDQNLILTDFNQAKSNLKDNTVGESKYMPVIQSNMYRYNWNNFLNEIGLPKHEKIDLVKHTKAHNYDSKRKRIKNSNTKYNTNENTKDKHKIEKKNKNSTKKKKKYEFVTEENTNLLDESLNNLTESLSTNLITNDTDEEESAETLSKEERFLQRHTELLSPIRLTIPTMIPFMSKKSQNGKKVIESSTKSGKVVAFSQRSSDGVANIEYSYRRGKDSLIEVSLNMHMDLEKKGSRKKQ